MQLALSHFGYRPDSLKHVTLCPSDDHAHLPERIPFYLRQNSFRIPHKWVWNPLKHWDVLYAYAINAIAWPKEKRHA